MTLSLVKPKKLPQKEDASLPEFLREKLLSPDELESWAEAVRANGETIATLNGSFDLLHAGHLFMISEAAKQADHLLVALNTDESIKRYKGAERPLIPLQYRLEMMSALSFVSNVIWFDEDDPRKMLSLVKPNVHINGPEWGEECVEASVVKENGGRIHIVKLIDGLSTTSIIEKIHEIASHV